MKQYYIDQIVIILDEYDEEMLDLILQILTKCKD